MSNGERREVEPGNPPVILMFQPTDYEVVPPDRLQEWEDALAEKVGLRGLGDLDPQAATGTWAVCGPKSNFDYCDVLN